MNAQKFTQKSLEAIQNAQSIAISAQSQQIEQVHLFAALVSQESGLIGQMMQKLGVNTGSLRQTLQSTIDSMRQDCQNRCRGLRSGRNRRR